MMMFRLLYKPKVFDEFYVMLLSRASYWNFVVCKHLCPDSGVLGSGTNKKPLLHDKVRTFMFTPTRRRSIVFVSEPCF